MTSETHLEHLRGEGLLVEIALAQHLDGVLPAILILALAVLLLDSPMIPRAVPINAHIELHSIVALSERRRCAVEDLTHEVDGGVAAGSEDADDLKDRRELFV